MYQLTVPYVMRIEEDGHEIRTPNIPKGWQFEQATSELDTGVDARSTKLAVIDIIQTRATVEAWMDTLTRPPVRADWREGRSILRERARTDHGAMVESIASRAAHAKDHIRNRRLLAKAERLGVWLLPFIALVGLAEAARLLGVETGVLLGATTAGTTLIEDAWSGSVGDDCEGRAPDTVDPGSGNFVTLIGANALEIKSGAQMASVGASATTHDVFIHSGMSAIADQFSETFSSERNATYPGVRLTATTATHTGYCARSNGGRIERLSATTGHTALTNGDANSGNLAHRVEIVGTTISVFIGTAGAYVPTNTVAWNTATDSTHATGVPGVEYKLTTRFVSKWRGGSLQPVSSAGFPFHHYYDSAGSL